MREAAERVAAHWVEQNEQERRTLLCEVAQERAEAVEEAIARTRAEFDATLGQMQQADLATDLAVDVAVNSAADTFIGVDGRDGIRHASRVFCVELERSGSAAVNLCYRLHLAGRAAASVCRHACKDSCISHRTHRVRHLCSQHCHHLCHRLCYCLSCTTHQAILLLARYCSTFGKSLIGLGASCLSPELEHYLYHLSRLTPRY